MLSLCRVVCRRCSIPAVVVTTVVVVVVVVLCSVFVCRQIKPLTCGQYCPPLIIFIIYLVFHNVVVLRASS